MVNSCSKVIAFYCILYSKNLFSQDLNTIHSLWPTNNMIIFLILLFVVATIILAGLLYYHKLKIEKNLGLFLSLENIWNSVSMMEARKKMPENITEDLFHSHKENDRMQLQYARVIIDFFNHIGLQVYQNIIRFTDVFSLFGKEIIEYWDKKKLKLFVYQDKKNDYHFHFNPYSGFEYLVQLSKERMNRVPSSYESNGNFRFSSTSSNILNLNLVIALGLAVISLIVFAFSYLVYKGYL